MDLENLTFNYSLKMYIKYLTLTGVQLFGRRENLMWLDLFLLIFICEYSESTFISESFY